ncbi:MAG: pilin [Steroidobacteraceae bacterium]
MKSTQQGFTLIELMIVVAIIGILAAIAIPAYQDYTVRAQVTEGLNLADAVKTGVAEYYANSGAWPTAMSQIGDDSDPSGKYATDLTLSTGTIQITFGGESNKNINGSTLLLQPRLSQNGDVVWLCGQNQGTGLNLTDPTTGTATAATGSTVANKYLPQSCRPQ